MTMTTLGLLILVSWPLYNLLLVATATLSRYTARRRERIDALAPAGYEPETFWIMIPCLNEARVVQRTVTSALSLAGPPGTKVYVLVIDDGSDDETPRVLAGIRDPNLVVLRRELPDARRGKGEALNAGYRFIRSCTELYHADPRRVTIGIIDGDGRGSANIIRDVSHAMRNPRVAAVQCRVRIHNRDRVLGAVQDLEFACVANAAQIMRDELGTVGLGGNGQFTRLSTLMTFGEAPWSGCLVEDLELGLRVHLTGEKVRYVAESNVTQQGVVDVRRLLRQRTRWAQGNLQCVRYIPQLATSREIGNFALLEMLYYLLAPWINACGTVAIVGSMIMTVVRMPWTSPTTTVAPGVAAHLAAWATPARLVALWTFALIAPYLTWAILHRVQLRDERTSRMLRAGVAYPAFLLLGVVATWRAIGRQLRGRQTWAKTERLAEEPNPSRLARPVPART